MNPRQPLLYGRLEQAHLENMASTFSCDPKMIRPNFGKELEQENKLLLMCSMQMRYGTSTGLCLELRLIVNLVGRHF